MGFESPGLFMAPNLSVPPEFWEYTLRAMGAVLGTVDIGKFCARHWAPVFLVLNTVGVGNDEVKGFWARRWLSLRSGRRYAQPIQTLYFIPE